MHKVIDVHSHMLSAEWLDLLRTHGAPRFVVKTAPAGGEVIDYDGIAMMAPQPVMFDYGYRIAEMDRAGVDVAILSLTGPNVYWGDAQASARAARAINDSFAAAQKSHPQRIRWLASLPFEYPDEALAELERAIDKGALGVVVLSNIGGAPLTDARFEPVWREIDRRKLPVFVHPTLPCGCGGIGIESFQLTASVAFPFDTTIAVARMIYSGFFDRFTGMRLIVSHGGGALPFLASRLDHCFEVLPGCSDRISEPPSRYLRRIFTDAVVYGDKTLADVIEAFGEDRVVYGTDFPHGIGDVSGILARIDRLPAELRDKLRGGNAMHLFGPGLF